MEYRPSVCPHDCPDACGLLVGVENGQVKSVQGDPDHPFTRGAACVKANHYAERLYSPDRVLYPLKRSGPKGSNQFTRISWDEALDTIVDRYKAIIEEYGAEAILPFSYAGTMGVVQFHGGHPFFHKLGASKLKRTICSASVEAGYKASLGNTPSTDIESVIHSDFIIIWGNNTLSTNMHAWPFFQEARRNGATIVVIDPYRNRTAKQADRHLALKPGTDAALALGIMNVLVERDLIDHEFIRESTVGFEQLRQRLTDYPLKKVEAITSVPAAQIEELALDYGRAKAPFIRNGWGPARQLKGGMATRTISLLPALVGAFNKRGGGIARSTSPAFGLKKDVVAREDLAPPSVRSINMVQLGSALNDLENSPIMALHVYHSNPAVILPDSQRVRQGLAREDLFLVVNELVMTDTALFADIVLPSATFLETTDIYRSYGHYYLQMTHPVIPAQGEARTTLRIFQDLAARFGFVDDCFSASEHDFIKAMLPDDPYFKGITYERLSQGRPIRLNVPENPFTDGFKTPSGKVEMYSQAMERAGLDPLPNGAPSIDTQGQGKYGLYLLTPPNHYFLNSTFNDTRYLVEKAGPPSVMIHPNDASKRNIEDGRQVRVYNDRGEIYVSARVTTDVNPGLTVVEGIYWSRHMDGRGCVNNLTSQKLTDMGETCALHCNLVEVELLKTHSEQAANGLETEIL